MASEAQALSIDETLNKLDSYWCIAFVWVAHCDSHQSKFPEVVDVMYRRVYNSIDGDAQTHTTQSLVMF